MDYTIVWADEAKENYRQIALYLLDAFGFMIADRFTDTINGKLHILETMPFIG
ncbi:type II toxin-antitoxin system RelE/ParE family toxin [Spirosoma aerophilum]